MQVLTGMMKAIARLLPQSKNQLIYLIGNPKGPIITDGLALGQDTSRVSIVQRGKCRRPHLRSIPFHLDALDCDGDRLHILHHTSCEVSMWMVVGFFFLGFIITCFHFIDYAPSSSLDQKRRPTREESWMMRATTYPPCHLSGQNTLNYC